jgi:hypothetical protein
LHRGARHAVVTKKTGAGDFEHTVIHSSIIRLSANCFINEYVRRLKGGTWKPLHLWLAYILDETYGILCYQEDVSKTAVGPVGFFDGISGGLSGTMQPRELLKSNTGTRGKGQEELFSVEPPAGYPRNRATGILAGGRKKTSPDELWEEYNALGFLRNVHPLALWKDRIAVCKRIKAIWLPQYVGGNVKLIGRYGPRTGLLCPF